jgi:His/Glu/Gln/Arg/opine family amino acid ABC transporter permease subunit
VDIEARKDMQDPAAFFTETPLGRLHKSEAYRPGGQSPVGSRIHARPKKSDWFWYAMLFVVAVLFVELVVDNPRWQWDIVAHYLFNKRVMKGLGNTLILTVLSSALGLCFGVVVAACRMADNAVLRAAGYVYIWIIRATPPIAMLLFLFFLSALIPRLYLPLPLLHANLFDIDTNQIISRFSAAVIGLAMYLGGYSAEIFSRRRLSRRSRTARSLQGDRHERFPDDVACGHAASGAHHHSAARQRTDHDVQEHVARHGDRLCRTPDDRATDLRDQLRNDSAADRRLYLVSGADEPRNGCAESA